MAHSVPHHSKFWQQVFGIRGADDWHYYAHEYLDDLTFLLKASDALCNWESGVVLIADVSKKFLSIGWDGDGELQVLWFPPFLGIGPADTFGCYALHVKQFADGLEQPILSGQKALYGPKDDPDQNKQLSDECRSYQNDKAQVAFTLLKREPVSGETSHWRPPFVSNDRSAYWLSRWAYQQLVARVEEQKKLSAQDLNNARMDVERYQKAIEFSQKRLADAEIKLADPTIGEHDRQFATSGQATQLKFLQENQENLRIAQQRLIGLEGTGSCTDSTQPTTTLAPSGQLLTSTGNVNLEPIVRPDGSIKTNDGSFWHINDGASK
jgi:hypothetical protein